MDWKIARRRDCCSLCGAVFAEKSRHVSTLCFRDAVLEREDLCPSCWERRERGQELFFWFTRQRRDRRGLALDLPTLEQLFLRLEGDERERVLELRYVISLLLLRKKRLKLVRIVRDPGEALILRRPRRDESLRVQVCDFDAGRMDALRLDLIAVFEGGEIGQEGPSGGAEEPAPHGAEAARIPSRVDWNGCSSTAWVDSIESPPGIGSPLTLSPSDPASGASQGKP